MATWTPAGSPGGVRPHRTPADSAHLKDFLHALRIDQKHIAEALTALHGAPPGRKIQPIPEVWLSNEEAKQHGLA